MNLRAWAAEAALHCATVALTVVILAGAFGPGLTTLSDPLAWGGDALFFQAFIQNYLETGSPLFSARRGAPFGTDMRDFPAVETLHLVTLRALACFSDDPNWLVNVFYFLGFPLTAITSLLALRALGLGRLAAAGGSVLYTFLPYHYYRFGHLFLAAYYLVPLLALTAVWVCHGKLSRGPDGRFPWGRWVAAVTVGLLASGGGVYYAFFGCFFLVVAGLARAAADRRPARLLPAAVLVAVITAGLMAQLVPTLHAQATQGKNFDVGARQPFEADMYGLRIMYLLLPVRQHQVASLGRLHEVYATTSPFTSYESGAGGLGLLGALGLVGLIGYFLFVPGRPADSLGHTLGLLTLAGILLATVTGFAWLFAYFVSPMIRAYNRVSIYLGFFALTAVGLVLNHLLHLARARGRLWHAAVAGGGLLVLTAGLIDQTPRPFFWPRPALPSPAAPTREFVAKLEAALPPGSMVLQLPIVSYPESAGVLGTKDYDHFRLSVFSRSLRWSHGVVRGRYPDAVLSALGRLPLEEQVEQAALMGYSGIHLDREGYPGQGKEAVGRLRQLLGVEPVASDDGRDVFFDLRPWADRSRQRVGATAWRELERDAGHPTEVELWSGSSPFNPADPERRRLFFKGAGAFELYNPLDTPRVVTLRFDVTAPAGKGAEAAEFRLSGDLVTAARAVGADPVEVRHQVTVPPGKHRVSIACVRGGKPAFFQLARFDVLNQPLTAGKGVARKGGE